MSRAVQTDHTFDPAKLARLIEKAKGNRTQIEYAKQCQVSLSYLNKYINKKQDTPPIPSSIKKLASCAQNGVSYEDMMEAAGYDPQKYMDIPANPQPTNLSDIALERMGISVIFSALAVSDFEWNNISSKSGSNFDLGISINNNSALDKWYFEFIPASNANPSDYIYNIYGRLASTAYEPNIKVSLVTTSVETYELIRELEPHKLPVFVSEILIDLAEFEVLQEDFLDSALPVNEEIQTIFTLAKPPIDFDAITKVFSGESLTPHDKLNIERYRKSRDRAKKIYKEDLAQKSKDQTVSNNEE